MLTLVYALCVVAPPLALAISDGTVAAHCLTEDHGFSHTAAFQGHEHQHAHAAAIAGEDVNVGGSANHHEKSHGHHHSGPCCGLFCHAAAANEQNSVSSERISHAVTLPVLDDHLAGRGPDRLIRPPIAL